MAFERKNDSNVTIIDSDDIDHDGKYKETPVTEADIALEDFLDKARAIGSTATLTINRISSGRNSSEIFCGKFPVDKYDYFDLLSLIQSNWGEGDYRIYCTVKGRKGVLQNTLVSVAPPPILHNSQNIATQNNSENILATVIKMMQENNERLIEAMKPQENDSDSMTKALNQMLLMKQVLGSDEKKTSMLGGVKEMVEVMALMKGLSEGAAPAESSGIMTALSAFAPVAVAAVTALANRQPTHQAPVNNRQFRPAPQPRQETVINEPIINEPVHTEPEAKNTMDAHSEAINNLITMLDTLGANGVDPALIAEKITEGIEDEQIEALGEWVSSDTAFKDLVIINPRVANYPEWFGDLIEHVKAQLGIESKVDHLYDSDIPESIGDELEQSSK
jgi:hypothetical protein